MSLFLLYISFRHRQMECLMGCRQMKARKNKFLSAGASISTCIFFSGILDVQQWHDSQRHFSCWDYFLSFFIGILPRLWLPPSLPKWKNKTFKSDNAIHESLKKIYESLMAKIIPQDMFQHSQHSLFALNSLRVHWNFNCASHDLKQMHQGNVLCNCMLVLFFYLFLSHTHSFSMNTAQQFYSLQNQLICLRISL